MAACGLAENRSGAGPINGPSQWIWGRSAAYRRRASVRHTVVGYCVHHVLATGWAVLHERAFGRGKPRQSIERRLAAGATTAAVACFVDYQLTPIRLRPGFETQLSRKSLALVYAAFALGLAASRRTRGTK